MTSTTGIHILNSIKYHALMAFWLAIVIISHYLLPNAFTFWHYILLAGAYGGYITLVLFVFVLKRVAKKNGGVLGV